ncbi:MarR family transcriptional regulator [candidate division GN15 bacterium]|nr:MarR family transcriptional regulator [candidate division GN15 bacterium]
MTDLVRQLGPLAVASRFKRLSDRLYRDISRIYAELDTDFEARWFLMLYLLAEEAPLSVTEAADRLGMTHPAVNQIVGAMTRAGLIASKRDRHDERRRLLSLTARGRRLHERLQPVWHAVAGQTAGWLAEADADVLAALDQLEAALDRREMYVRVAETLSAAPRHG